MAWQKGNVISGARSRFLLGNKPVGFATNVNVQDRYNLEPIEVLGNIRVQEHVPTGYYVSGSAGTVRLFGQSFKSAQLNLWPKVGGSPEEHLANVLALAQADLNAILQDTVNSRNFVHLTEVQLSSRNLTVQARGIVGEDVDFVAITALDEEEE